MSILFNFPVAMIKYPKKSKLRGKGLFRLIGEGTVQNGSRSEAKQDECWY